MTGRLLADAFVILRPGSQGVPSKVEQKSAELKQILSLDMN
jgi:hypothetical protein